MVVREQMAAAELVRPVARSTAVSALTCMTDAPIPYRPGLPWRALFTDGRGAPAVERRSRALKW
jgi:hypothetical protein